MNSWQEKNLGDFLTQKKREVAINPNREYSLVTISNKGIVRLRGKKRGAEIAAKKAYLAKAGDFIYSRLAAHTGAFGIVDKELDNALVTGEMPCFEIDEHQVHPDILISMLNLPTSLWQLGQFTQGVGRVRIKERVMLSLSLLLPDISEQKKLSKKIQSFKHGLVQLDGEFSSQRELLTRLRRRVLQEAIEGKLTADWRKGASRNYESAEVLLKRISQEKERLIKAGEIAKQKPLPPVADSEKPFALPKGWAWSRLGNLGLINPRNKGIKDDCIVGFSPMRLIGNGYCEPLKHEEKPWREVANGFTHIADDDVVVAKITPCFENSKGGVVKDFPNGIGAGTTELYVFRKITNYTCPEFIHINLKAKGFLDAGKKLMKGTAGQQRVPRGFIENRLIPLPPLAEQRAIVAKVEKLLALCDSLQAEARNNEALAKRLMQAALKEAFTPPQG